MNEVIDNIGGLRPVELNYRAIREISSGRTVYYQSVTKLNSPGLGVMMPEAYREVAEMSPQCLNLFSLELSQALEAIVHFTDREVNFGWVSVYMPVWFLKEKRAERIVVEQCEKAGVPTNRLCFELGEKLLTESDEAASSAITNLRNRGFHFMLTDFGGNACPMMRLANFSVDYVMLSPEVANYIGKTDRSDSAVKSIIGFIGDMGGETIADGVSSSHQAETLYEFECSYCSGPLAGNYVAEKFVRGKSTE